MTPGAAERVAAMRVLGNGGLAREVLVSRSPERGLVTVGADVGLRLRGGERPGPFDLAGASGPTLAHTVPRAAGEAVERYAVANLGHAESPIPDPGATPWDRLPPALREGYPSDLGRPVYPAHDLRTGAAYALPAELVDFPNSHAHWPGSPSGAAAHLSREAARHAALIEMLERDGVMRAWFGRVELVELNFADGPPLPNGRPLLAGDRLRVLRTSTAIKGLNCYLAARLNAERCGCGAAVDCDDRRAAARAVREAMQVSDLLELLDSLLNHDPAADRRLGPEIRRARFWASADSTTAFDELCDGAQSGLAAPSGDAALPRASELVERLPASVLPLEVDLTYRIPATLQDAGWRACKVIALGLQ